MNAIYYHIITGELVDPTGGIKDIEKRRIRATGTDPSYILGQDGLRLVRLVRFAQQLGFEIETKTWGAALESKDLLKDITKMRLGGEFSKILTTTPGFLLASERLQALGAYELMLGLDSVDVDKITDLIADSVLRLSALLWRMPPLHAKEMIINLGLGAQLAKDVFTILSAKKEAKDDVHWAMAQLGRDLAWRFSVLYTGGWAAYDEMVERRIPFSVRELDVNGRDVVAIVDGPSPLVGAVLNDLWRLCVAQPEENAKESLLGHVRYFAKKYDHVPISYNN